MLKFSLLSLLVFITDLAICRDFYIGMFKKNDYLVAQDRLFKEKRPFGIMYAKYGRKFNCPITYVRVVDRLGYGKGPVVELIRGGLQKYYVVLRLRAYNAPINVNVYVGCANKAPQTTKPTTKKASTAAGGGAAAAGGPAANATTIAQGSANGTTAGNSTGASNSAGGASNSTGGGGAAGNGTAPTGNGTASTGNNTASAGGNSTGATGSQANATR